MNKELSLIIPAYEEEDSLPELCDWIIKVIDQNEINAECILIDDGSADMSWKFISAIAKSDPRFYGIRMRGNQGKSAALQSGFNHASGKVVITLDADLQDSPDEIPELLKMIKEGYDLVSGWKKKRSDPLEKTIPSKFFNWVTRIVSGIKIHDFNCGLKAYSIDVVKTVKLYGEMHRYIPLLAKWNGFTKIGEKIVDHRPRKYGQTKFGLERYLNGFLDLLSVLFVTKFKKKPMHFFGGLGFFSFFMGFVVTMLLIGQKIYRTYADMPTRDIVDQPLFFLALVALILGVNLFLAGFLAELILRMGSRKNEYIILETTEDRQG